MGQDPGSTVMQMVTPLDGAFPAVTGFEVPRQNPCAICISSFTFKGQVLLVKG